MTALLMLRPVSILTDRTGVPVTMNTKEMEKQAAKVDNMHLLDSSKLNMEYI